MCSKDTGFSVKMQKQSVKKGYSLQQIMPDDWISIKKE